ncbi:F-box/LRR-repeat protein At3g48880-like isoform X1 [Tasmannia lanceolata]|uniref:F-box/LRR-repeat protein At3g48880-like isoform X1 n=2 Tax=Tasmannia lanceolata TaxID=3420 RepID=UPI00406448AC
MNLSFDSRKRQRDRNKVEAAAEKAVQSFGNCSQIVGKLVKMEDCNPTVRQWEDMIQDCLVEIFRRFSAVDFTSGIAEVCSSWRLACSDQFLWRTLDLGQLKSNFIKIPYAPYVWVDDRSNQQLTRVLKIAMGLSRGNISCIIFHFNLYLMDNQLIYVANRCPRLKQLVIPAWNRMTKGGICKAIRMWGELESMTMPSIRDPAYVMDEIRLNCKNFTQLKIMGPCNIFLASSIVTFLPKLKVLSLRCSKLFKEALVMILDSLEHLEVLNISHCLLIEAPPPPAPVRVFRELDEAIVEKASRLREFFHCQRASCVLCQRTINDDGLMRWYKYEEGLWRTDEVISLSF